MQFDWKHLAALVIGAALSLGLAAASKNGIEIPCPSQPSAVISVPGK